MHHFILDTLKIDDLQSHFPVISKTNRTKTKSTHFSACSFSFAFASSALYPFHYLRVFFFSLNLHLKLT